MKRKVIDYIVYLGITLLCISVGTGMLGFYMVDAKQQIRYKTIMDRTTIVKDGVELGEGLAETSVNVSNNRTGDSEQSEGGSFDWKEMFQEEKPVIKSYFMMFPSLSEAGRIVSINDGEEKDRLGLPEDALLETEIGNIYNIWIDGYTIRLSEEECQKRKGDMNIIDAVDKARIIIEQTFEKVIDCKEIGVYMLDKADVFGESQSLQQYGGFYHWNGNVGGNYGQCFYEINFYMVENERYSVRMNTITGEITSLIYYNSKKMSVNWYEKDDIVFFDYITYGEYEAEGELYTLRLEKVQNYYFERAEKFINETFLGNYVTEFFGCASGEIEIPQEMDTRIVMTVFCKTESGTIYGIIFDQESKSICGYEVNPILY